MRNGRGEAFERSVEIMTPLPVKRRTGTVPVQYRMPRPLLFLQLLLVVPSGGRQPPRSKEHFARIVDREAIVWDSAGPRATAAVLGQCSGQDLGRDGHAEDATRLHGA